MRDVDLWSAFGGSSKIALGLPIPPHSLDGILPPAFHLLQGMLVRCVTFCDHFLEMSVLRLYDLVRGHAMVGMIARATQLLTGHRLHEPRSFSLDLTRARTTSMVASTSGSAISSTSRTRPASTWNTKATLTA